MARPKWSWLRNFNRPTRPIRKTPRLGCELLEARDVPATAVIDPAPITPPPPPVSDTFIVNTANDEVSANDGFTSLREAIIAANASPNVGGTPDVITFAPNMNGATIDLNGSDLPTITEPVTIDATSLSKGVTINAGGNSGIFDISYNVATSVPTILSGLILTDGSKFQGGAIYSSEALTIESCTITNNKASDDGGGVFATGDLTITSSTISGNVADSDHVPAGSGGGVYGQANITVDGGSIISGNTATDGGGIAHGSSNGRVLIDQGSSVTANHAVHYTTASGVSTGGNGGGISADVNVTISGADISKNIADVNGGGIYSSSGRVTIQAGSNAQVGLTAASVGVGGDGSPVPATVRGNTAGGSGGGIYASGSVFVTEGSSIANNDAVADGGGIYASCVTVDASTVSDNTADAAPNNSDGQGGGIWASSYVIVKHESKVSGNTAKHDGGGVYGGNVSIIGSVVSENHTTGGATSGGAPQANAGGGVYARTGITLSASGQASGQHSASINDNSSGYGGGLYAESGNISITGSSVDHNTAAVDGGGVDANDGNVTLGSKGAAQPTSAAGKPAASVTGNTAGADGGGIYNNRGFIAIDDAEVSDNHANHNGGGIFNGGSGSGGVGSDVSIRSNAHVFSNSASGNGGGIYTAAGNVKVTDSAIGLPSPAKGDGAPGAAAFKVPSAGNSTGGSGGGIYSSGGVTLIRSVVANNTAGANGGGVFAQKTIDLQSTAVSYNSAAGNGGGVYADGNVTVGVTSEAKSASTGSLVYTNTAKNGGGIYSSGGNVKVITSVVENNQAHIAGSSGGMGGGIYANTGNVSATGSLVKGNSADSFHGLGGGIYANLGNVTIKGSGSLDGHGLGVIQNVANQGGGVYVKNGNVIVVDSTVADNTAAADGGGVFVATGNVSILSSTLSGNSANSLSGNGGGINDADTTGTVTVTHSTISGNAAAMKGGGIASANTATVNNSTIVLNTVGMGGAGAGLDTANGLTINNTIVAGNTANGNNADIGGIATGANNLIGNAGSSGGLLDRSSDPGHGNIVGVSGEGTRSVASIIDPTLRNNGGPTLTHALMLGSAATRAGNVAATTALGLPDDQRGAGFPRIVGARVDIGALEGTSAANYVVTDGGRITIYNQNGVAIGALTPFGTTQGTRVMVAVGDVSGDGVPDIVCTGRNIGVQNSSTQVVVYDGVTGALIARLRPYGKSYNKPAAVAIGDVTTAGQGDIVLAPWSNANMVKVFSLSGGNLVQQTAYDFHAFPTNSPMSAYKSGFSVAVGNFAHNAGHTDQIVIATDQSTATRPTVVQVWGYHTTSGIVPYELSQFNANTAGPGAAQVAAGDVNGDGWDDIILGTDSSRTVAQVYNGNLLIEHNTISSAPVTALFGGPTAHQDTRVAVTDNAGDGKLHIVLATGPGNVQEVESFHYDSSTQEYVLDTVLNSSALTLTPSYTSGLFVAGAPLSMNQIA